MHKDNVLPSFITNEAVLSRSPLPQAFYIRDALVVAEDLIGCILVHRPDGPGGDEIIVMITETEAYRGTHDPASHAYNGMTPRTTVMFGEAGRFYVYISYGMHCCVNIVTNLPGEAGAVLLRGAVPLSGLDIIRANRPGVPDKSLINGPGKLTKGIGITMDHYGYNLLEEGEFALLDKISPLPIRRTGRIGISKAVELPWRFIADIPEYKVK